MYLNLALPTLHFLPFALIYLYFLTLASYLNTTALPTLSPSHSLHFFIPLAILITICHLLSFNYVLHLRREAADEGREQRCQYVVLEVCFDADDEEGSGIENGEWREEIGRWREDCAIGAAGGWEWRDRRSIESAEWFVYS
ncbi:hypothetical protein ACMFMF_001448 [Clarireedia jacksonii]